MSNKPRVTLIDKEAKSTDAKIAPFTQTKGGKEYLYYRVRWSEGGKTKTKQFKELPNAESYKSNKDLELKGLVESKQPLMTSMTKQQAKSAENAFRQLGGIYSLEEVMGFFLKHHRPPEYTLKLSDALKHFKDAKERAGISERQIRTLKTTINAFIESAGDLDVHTVTEQQVRSYLKALKSRDGESQAKFKTWNSRRNEISSFFKFAMDKDLETHRPWTFHNPVENIETHSKDKVRQQRPPIATTDPKTALELLTYAMNYKGGAMAKYYAIAYFTGIRPSPEVNNGELTRLSLDESLINMKTKTIKLHASMTKDKRDRTVTISDNLKAWLEAYKDSPIIPPKGINLARAYRHIRQKFKLQHDETRHSFISYHVALNRSIGDAALEAGNSEAKVKEHYLNHRPQEDAQAFWSIVPDMETMQAVITPAKPKTGGKITNIKTA